MKIVLTKKILLSSVQKSEMLKNERNIELIKNEKHVIRCSHRHSRIVWVNYFLTKPNDCFEFSKHNQNNVLVSYNSLLLSIFVTTVHARTPVVTIAIELVF